MAESPLAWVFYVVTPELIVIADIKASVTKDRMGPGIVLDTPRHGFEATDHIQALGTRLDERYGALLVQAI